MSKICTRCDKTLPFTDFTVKGLRKDGSTKYSSRCKPCQAKKKKETYCPEKKRESDLKNIYGITLQEYNEMLVAQDYKCAGCGTMDTTFSKGKRFAVDHCHETGRVRGLLCGRCNVALGLVNDEVTTLRNLIKYLER